MTNTAQQTVDHARHLQATMQSEMGVQIDLATAYKLIRAGQQAGRETDEQLASDARDDRVQRGMVAGYVRDMRAVGAWDGE